MKRISIILSFLFLLLSCGLNDDSGMEQSISEENSLSVELIKGEISTSERSVISVVLRYSKEYQPVMPQWAQLFDPVEINNIKSEGSSFNYGESYQKEVVITLDYLLPGDYILKPVSVNLKGEEGDLTLQSEHLELKVTSNLQEKETFIDSFEPLRTKSHILPVIVLVVSLIIIIFFSILLLRKKRQTIHPPVPTAEIYKKKIETLNDELDEKTFYHQLSNLVKEYLDNTLFLSVQSSTFLEIALLTEDSMHLPEEWRLELLSLLNKAEAIVFSQDSSTKINRSEDKAKMIALLDKIDSSIRMEAEL